MADPAPRIAPGGRADVGLLTWLFALASGRVTRTTPPNLFLTLGRQRRLFHGWLHFAGRLMPGGALPRRESELVILRVAHLTDCAYEAAHHRRLAARAGLTSAEIERVVDGPDAEGWSERDRMLLRVTDELHRDRDLSDDAWASVGEHLDDATAIELLLLVTHYEMLATTINTLRIAVDRPRGRTMRST